MSTKAVFIYSAHTGTSRHFKRIEKIKVALTKTYPDIEFRRTHGEEDFHLAVEESLQCEVTILYGGDGSFNYLCHVYAQHEKSPLIGYIPGGTLNDCGKPFGLRNIRKAMKAIEKGTTKEFDVVSLGDSHFSYMAAIGAYSDISYVASRRRKKKIGKLDYYLIAIKEAFHKRQITIKVDGEEYVTPFLLMMNGSHVGGFRVNKKGDNNDGVFELFITKPGLFNGLVHYAFGKFKTIKLRASSFEIECDGEQWCIDGEKGPAGSLKASISPNKLRIIA